MKNLNLRTRIFSTPYDHHLAEHPIFVQETRYARWAWPLADFRRRMLRMLLISHLVVIGLWLVLALLWYADLTRWSYYNSDPLRTFYNAGANAFVLLFFLIWVVGSEIEFGGLRSALNSISGEIAARRWDLLRLTALNERGIVNAKHGVAQMRMWRTVTRQMSLRVALAVLLIFYALVLPAVFFGIHTLADNVVYNPIGTVGGVVICILIGLVFIIEPLWRMKAMTALGIVISAYVENSALATLASLGVVFTLWLLQTIIMLVLLMGSAFLGTSVFFTAYYTNSEILVILYILIVTLITTITIYGFYHLLQIWSLRRATLRILKGN